MSGFHLFLKLCAGRTGQLLTDISGGDTYQSRKGIKLFPWKDVSKVLDLGNSEKDNGNRFKKATLPTGNGVSG